MCILALYMCVCVHIHIYIYIYIYIYVYTQILWHNHDAAQGIFVSRA